MNFSYCTVALQQWVYETCSLIIICFKINFSFTEKKMKARIFKLVITNIAIIFIYSISF